MRFASLFLAFILIELYQMAEGASFGPPDSACWAMLPCGHPLNGETSTKLGFTISTNQTSFLPGEVIEITVSGPNSIKGLFLQVRRPFLNNAVGSFVNPVPSGFKLMVCPNQPSSSDKGAVGHFNPDLKGNSATFVWRPPVGPCDDDDADYEIRATVVTTFATYETGISGSIFCDGYVEIEGEESDNDDDDDDDDDVCIYSNVTVIFGKYNTSFESGFDGWINNGFTRHAGITLSTDTGPSSAYDGDYYAYFETSYPAQIGATATLTSTNDLAGCFCLTFYHQHAVREDTDHLFRVEVNRETALEIEETDAMWHPYQIQVDQAGPVEIRFVATRGNNWQGDTALDFISISQGLCTE
ncbi:uncharacterized protein LOC100178472 isoform X2 [Ciona intestinalis]